MVFTASFQNRGAIESRPYPLQKIILSGMYEGRENLLRCVKAQLAQIVIYTLYGVLTSWEKS